MWTKKTPEYASYLVFRAIPAVALPIEAVRAE